ncbi:MAG: transporter [Aeromicrobium sp.]|nr:transporter [Aeromicrobium sp.]
MSYAIIALATSSFALMQSMTVPVLPRIEQELHTSQTTVTWVLTAYLLSASVATPIIGRLGDIVGKKRMLVFSMLCLSAGSLIAALAPTIGVMLIGRVITGICGGVLPLSFVMIRDVFPEKLIAGAVSLVSSLTAVGFGAGIIVAGPIVDSFGYAWLFWLPFIVTSLGALGAAILVPESPVRTPGRIPLLPAVLLAGWLVSLLLGLSQAPKWGWGSPEVIALLLLAVVLASIWMRVETRVAVPLIDMKMMRLKGVWTTNLVALVVGFSMYASFGFLPQFLQTPESTGYGIGATVTESGTLMLPQAGASFVCGLIAASLARLIGAKVVVVFGSLLGACGMAALAMVHETHLQLLFITGFMGFGVGLVFSSLAGLIIAAVPPEQTGVASGMNANIRTIGGSIGSAVMSTVVTSQMGSSGYPLESGYVHGFALLSGMLVLSALTGLLIPSISRRNLEKLLAQEPAGERLAPSMS